MCCLPRTPNFPRLPRQSWSEAGEGCRTQPGEQGRAVLRRACWGVRRGPRAPGPAGRAAVHRWSPSVPSGPASNHSSRSSRLVGRGPDTLGQRGLAPWWPAQGSCVVPEPAWLPGVAGGRLEGDLDTERRPGCGAHSWSPGQGPRAGPEGFEHGTAREGSWGRGRNRGPGLRGKLRGRHGRCVAEPGAVGGQPVSGCV